ncbi:MAG: DUF4135 domain-containing protein [Bdellovibrionaceae bacterium]|nr:DUF4135 domain-containing protein [Pseudobdellovibrionaceae bacterium]
MIQLIDADRHNFRKCVQRVERASGHFYLKPRSIYWEHLFFGNKSPLIPIFDLVGRNGDKSLASFIFNLEIEQENNWLGYSREVSRAEVSISPDHFYSFGVLLGYCYLFGIRDLHKNNVVLRKNHFQVIDAEVVLTDLILPNETLLLPFREIPFESSAASLLCSDLKGLDEKQIHSLFSGYFDMATAILDNLEDIMTVFNKEDLSVHSLRVILKNTKEYRDFLSGTGKLENFIPEELTQLDRGDIPYFFKFAGKDELLYLSAPESSEVVSTPTEDLKRDIKRHGKPAAQLLGSSPDLIKKIATGALYMRRIFSFTDDMEWVDKGGLVSLNGSSLNFRNFLFSANSRPG